MVVLAASAVPAVQCCCLGRLFSLLVSDPSMILKDGAIKWFLCVSLREGESWKCAMQPDRCSAVLSGEAVSRDIELGNLDILVLGGGKGGRVEIQVV